MLFPPQPQPLPDWLPASVRRELSGKSVQFRLPKPVRLRLRSPEKIKVSEWAERYRVVTDGPHEGPWRHDHAPHTVKIMDTFGLPWVREIWFCGVEQSGKTNTMLNCLGWCIDCDPGNTFYLMPTEDTAAKVTGGKLKPLIQRSPRLARYLTGRADDVSLSGIMLSHGVTIRPAHSNSASSMATWAAKHCFGDEVDKYPVMAGKEADPITLIKKRNRTYKGRYKRFFASTPAGLYIHKGMMNCHQVWENRVKCPHCGEYIRMDVEHLVFELQASTPSLLTPDSSLPTPEAVERDGVQYACNACGAIWDDRDRESAIRAGRWICVQGGDVTRPHKVGFHHRSWECLDIPLTEIAAAWLRAKSGALPEKVAWANGYEAIDYEADLSDRKEDAIMALADDSLPQGVIPPDTAALLVLADTQKHGFMYQVVAVGYAPHCAPALVNHGFVESFDALNEIRDREYQDAYGIAYSPHAGMIDSGGGTNPFNPKHSRTSEVYEFCRLNKFWRPVKGRRDQATPWTTTRLDYYPSRDGKKKPIPGGLTLYTINVTHYKNQLATKLAINPGDPGAIRLHSGLLADGPNSGRQYAAQLCAEYRDERGYWECPRGKANHFWDCWVYGFAAMDILGVRRKTKPDAAPAGSQRSRRIYSQGVD
jgi:phage terminase large subunit GpA-like protein